MLYRSCCALQSSVLEVKLVSDMREVPAGYGSYRAGAKPPEGHFIVLPSSNCSLLVKSIAVSELVMPADLPTIDQHSQRRLDSIASVLDKVRDGVHMRSSDVDACRSACALCLSSSLVARRTCHLSAVGDRAFPVAAEFPTVEHERCDITDSFAGNQ